MINNQSMMQAFRSDGKAEEDQRRQEVTRMEKMRYAEELLPEIPHFSDNMGIRRKHLNKTSLKYAELTALLREIYISNYPNFETNGIYRNLVRLTESEPLIDNIKKCEAHLQRLSERTPNWMGADVNTSTGYWVQVTYRSKRDQQGINPGKPGNLKVYARLNTYDIQEVFIESLRYLLTNANSTFAAKISTYNRSDQMCYWLSPKDFTHLEKYYAQYSDKMVRAMPFVAYKGKLGISKEFPDADSSHNATQAHIIADYLKSISYVEEVDLEAMYNNYIAKWNADIYEAEEYGSFKQSSALSFIVIMDTIDIILEKSPFYEESCLLSDNSRFWHILSQSKCWADVNERFREV